MLTKAVVYKRLLVHIHVYPVTRGEMFSWAILQITVVATVSPKGYIKKHYTYCS